MLRRSRVFVSAAFLLMAGPASTQQPQPEVPDTNGVTQAATDMGRAIFHGKGTCFACHGPNLEGSQIAPTLKAHAWRDAKNGELAEIFRVVTHGVPSTVMVPHPGGISDAEALAVASYIWSVSHRSVKP
jgi:mono/diheme cytochrome c family protein